GRQAMRVNPAGLHLSIYSGRPFLEFRSGRQIRRFAPSPPALSLLPGQRCPSSGCPPLRPLSDALDPSNSLRSSLLQTSESDREPSSPPLLLSAERLSDRQKYAAAGGSISVARPASLPVSVEVES